MDVSQELAQALRSASRLDEVAEEPARSLGVAALAAVVSERHGVSARTPGISWLGEHGEVNTLLLVGDRFAHARVDGERAFATSYPGPVATVEAAGVAQVSKDSGSSWSVAVWHVTLADGAVISLEAAQPERTEKVAEFVRAHLLP